MTATTTEKIDDSILRKFERLIALMERPGTEDEGLAAAAAVQKFALKYGLEASTFAGNAQGAAPKKHKGVEEDVSTNYGAQTFKVHIAWKVRLFQRVCEANFCHPSFYESGREVRFSVVGKSFHVNVAKKLYTYLEGVVDQVTIQAILARRARIKLEQGGVGPGQGNTAGREWGDSFRLGMVEKIYERMIAEQKRASQEGYAADAASGEEATSALVVRTAVENEKADLQKYYDDLSTKRDAEFKEMCERARQLKADTTLASSNATTTQEPAAPYKPPTKAELAREAAQARKYERRNKAWERRQEREEQKWNNRNTVKNSEGYHAGRQAGEKVSVSPLESK